MSTAADPCSIRRLRLRLHCDQAQGRALQQRASRLFHCRLQSQLQALFARLAAQLGTRTLVLDRLVLDLGEIATDDFDQQFAHRLLTQLEQRLGDLIGSLPSGRQNPAEPRLRPFSPDSDHPPRAERTAAAAGAWPALVRNASAGAWPPSPEQVAPVAAVLAYLQDGYWPLPASWRAGPGAWLRRQIDAGTYDWTPLLALCCSRSDALRRLRGTFDLVTQSALQHAVPAGWTPVESKAAERWQRWRSAVQGGQDAGDIELEAFAVPARTGLSADVSPASARTGQPSDMPPASARTGQPSDTPSASARTGLPSDASPASTRTGQPSDAPPASTRTGQPSDAPPASTRTGQPSDTPSASARTGQPSNTPFIPTRPTATDSTLDPLIPIAVSNAGLVLLWPMLARLFNQLQLLDKSEFIDDAARARAVCLLDWLLWDDAGLEGAPPAAVDASLEPEWRTPMSKLLCGWPLAQPLPGWYRPSPGQRQLLRTWLFSSLGLWPAMQRVGTAWARELFLRREGQVLCSPGRVELVVARDASDALLHDLPWPLQEIDLPWMPAPLLVDWIEPGQTWQDLISGIGPA